MPYKQFLTAWSSISFIMLQLSVYSQSDSLILAQNENEKVLEWIEDLYEHGVSTSSDSIIINEESQRLMSDEDYRDIIYPTVYTWEMTTKFMADQELKKAFWYMLNLYLVNDKNKDLVIKSILSYNRLFKMDEIMEATYKTYALLDPAIGVFKNGQTEITSPHILEEKLYALKEILFYIEKYKKDD